MLVGLKIAGDLSGTEWRGASRLRVGRGCAAWSSAQRYSARRKQHLARSFDRRENEGSHAPAGEQNI